MGQEFVKRSSVADVTAAFAANAKLPARTVHALQKQGGGPVSGGCGRSHKSGWSATDNNNIKHELSFVQA